MKLYHRSQTVSSFAINHDNWQHSLERGSHTELDILLMLLLRLVYVEKSIMITFKLTVTTFIWHLSCLFMYEHIKSRQIPKITYLLNLWHSHELWINLPAHVAVLDFSFGLFSPWVLGIVSFPITKNIAQHLVSCLVLVFKQNWSHAVSLLCPMYSL